MFSISVDQLVDVSSTWRTKAPIWKMLKRFNFFDKELLEDLHLPSGITCSACLSTGVLLIGKLEIDLAASDQDNMVASL